MTDEDRKEVQGIRDVLNALLDKEKSVDRAIMGTASELIKLGQDIDGLKKEVAKIRREVWGE